MLAKPPARFLAFFVAFFLAANALDILVTIDGLQRGADEANPFMAHVLDHYGLIAMDALKVALVGSVAWLLWRLALRRPIWRFALVGFGILVLGAVELNIVGISSLR